MCAGRATAEPLDAKIAGAAPRADSPNIGTSPEYQSFPAT